MEENTSLWQSVHCEDSCEGFLEAAAKALRHPGLHLSGLSTSSLSRLLYLL